MESLGTPPDKAEERMARTRISNTASTEVTLQAAYQSSLGDLLLALGTIFVISGVILHALR